MNKGEYIIGGSILVVDYNKELTADDVIKLSSEKATQLDMYYIRKNLHSLGNFLNVTNAIAEESKENTTKILAEMESLNEITVRNGGNGKGDEITFQRHEFLQRAYNAMHAFSKHQDDDTLKFENLEKKIKNDISSINKMKLSKTWKVVLAVFGFLLVCLQIITAITTLL